MSGAILRSRRSTKTAADGLVADQYRNLALITPRLRVAERTGLDLVSRHAGPDQRFMNRAHTTRLGAVDCDPCGRILIQVIRNLLRLVAVGTQNVVTAYIESVIPVRTPAPISGSADASHRALRARRTGRALRTCTAGSASWAADACQLCAALSARRSRRALRACNTCRTRRAGRADRSGTLRTGAAGYALYARGTGMSSRAGRTCDTLALDTRLACGTLRTSRAGGTRFTGTTDYHHACSARCAGRALHAF